MKTKRERETKVSYKVGGPRLLRVAVCFNRSNYKQHAIKLNYL